jgi:hypothetical protein
MSLIENIRSKGKHGGNRVPFSDAPAAPGILVKLGTAEEQFERQHRKVEELSLAVVQGDVDREVLVAENAALSDLRLEIETLRAAHKIAVEKDAVAMRGRRTAQRKKDLAKCQAFLDARNAAAIEFSKALEDAVVHYRALVENSEKAVAAVPFGSEAIVGAQSGIKHALSRYELRRLLSHELYRVANDPGAKSAIAFPQAQAPSRNFEWAPATIRPLVDIVVEQSRYAAQRLTDDVTGNPTGLVE